MPVNDNAPQGEDNTPWYDKVSGFMGLGDNKTVDPNTGLTPQQQNLIGYNQLGSLGALLLAAGQKQMPSERARYLGQIGNIPAQYAQQQQAAIQQNAMAEKLRQQRNFREMIGKDTTLSDTQKTLLMNSPEAAAAYAKNQFPQNPEGTNDVKNYSYYVKQEQAAGKQPMNFLDWQSAIKRAGAASTEVKVGETADVAIAKDAAKNLSDKVEAANNILPAFERNNEVRDLLDKGVITGFGANRLVQLGSAAQKLGYTQNDDRIANSQVMIAQLKGALLENARKFPGSMSDKDRESLEAMSANPEMNEKAIRDLLSISDRYNKKIYDSGAKASVILKNRKSIQDAGLQGAYDLPEIPVYKPQEASGGISNAAPTQQGKKNGPIRIDLEGKPF
jgi:hypothetical protein